MYTCTYNDALYVCTRYCIDFVVLSDCTRTWRVMSSGRVRRKKNMKTWSAAERYRRKTVGFVSADKTKKKKTSRIYRNFVSQDFRVSVQVQYFTRVLYDVLAAVGSSMK
jgi:hypothetical protein